MTTFLNYEKEKPCEPDYNALRNKLENLTNVRFALDRVNDVDLTSLVRALYAHGLGYDAILIERAWAALRLNTIASVTFLTNLYPEEKLNFPITE